MDYNTLLTGITELDEFFGGGLSHSRLNMFYSDDTIDLSFLCFQITSSLLQKEQGQILYINSLSEDIPAELISNPDFCQVKTNDFYDLNKIFTSLASEDNVKLIIIDRVPYITHKQGQCLLEEKAIAKEWMHLLNKHKSRLRKMRITTLIVDEVRSNYLGWKKDKFKAGRVFSGHQIPFYKYPSLVVKFENTLNQIHSLYSGIVEQEIVVGYKINATIQKHAREELKEKVQALDYYINSGLCVPDSDFNFHNIIREPDNEYPPELFETAKGSKSKKVYIRQSPIVLSDEEWESIKDIIPPSQSKGRKQRDIREIVDALIYKEKHNCSLRSLTDLGYPAKSTLDDHIKRFKDTGIWSLIKLKLQL